MDGAGAEWGPILAAAKPSRSRGGSSGRRRRATRSSGRGGIWGCMVGEDRCEVDWDGDVGKTKLGETNGVSDEEQLRRNDAAGRATEEQRRRKVIVSGEEVSVGKARKNNGKIGKS